ncbi:DUF4214 domain-containing protein [Vibrio parahaemolyticus]
MKNNGSYDSLTEFVNSNLASNGLNTLIFERNENLTFSIYNFPCSKLLSIQNDVEFLYEAYYKILDRTIDEASLIHLSSKLKSKQITKKSVINSLFNSSERKVKKTLIDFES